FRKGIEFHLESFTSRTSPVQALLKNVFLDARGYKSVYGLAAMGAFSSLGGGDVARNSFEEIDRSLTQMCYELRGRHGFAFTLGVSRGHEVRRNNQAERFRANAGTIGDDEIAKTEERFVFLPHGNIEEGIRSDHEEDVVAGVGVAKVANGVHGIVELIAGEIV